MTREALYYDEVVNRQDVALEDLELGDYFLHEVTEAESEKHAGEIYALPRFIQVPGKEGLYRQEPNGAVVSQDAKLSGNNTLSARSVIHASSHIVNTFVGKRAVIDGSSVVESHIESDTSIGEGSVLLNGCYVAKGTNIGKGSVIGHHVEIGGEVKVGDRVTIDPACAIRNSRKIKAGRHVVNAELGRIEKSDNRTYLRSASHFISAFKKMVLMEAVYNQQAFFKYLQETEKPYKI